MSKMIYINTFIIVSAYKVYTPFCIFMSCNSLVLPSLCTFTCTFTWTINELLAFISSSSRVCPTTNSFQRPQQYFSLFVFDKRRVALHLSFEWILRCLVTYIRLQILSLTIPISFKLYFSLRTLSLRKLLYNGTHRWYQALHQYKTEVFFSARVKVWNVEISLNTETLSRI